MRRFRTLRFPAALENVPRAIDCVGRSARRVGFGDRAVRQIQLAVDEACANVVEHAYANMPPGQIEIVCGARGRDLVICVRDWGGSFAPEKVPLPDIDAPLEERELGGLGLFLIRHLMDEVQFTFDPVRGNELVMVKHFAQDGTAAVPS